jgi:ATP-dependent Clp protease ATP-binding subunit ClpA
MMSKNRPVTVASIVRAARVEAIADGARAVEAEHLLLALAAGENSAAQLLLAGAGLDHDTIHQALVDERRHSLETVGVAVAASPEPVRDPRAHLDFAASARQALVRGAASNTQKRRRRLSSAHLLVGVLGAKVGTVPRARQLAGVDRAALTAAAVQLTTAGQLATGASDDGPRSS